MFILRLLGALMLSSLTDWSVAASCVSLPIEIPAHSRISIAISGEVVAVGLADKGLVYLYRMPTAGSKPAPLTVIETPGIAGFGYALAMTGNQLVVGAYGVYRSLPAEAEHVMEYPKGVFHHGAIYQVSLKSGEMIRLAGTDQDRVVGHSVAATDKVLAYGMWEQPKVSNVPLGLQFAAQGSVVVQDIANGQRHVVQAPAGALGFGMGLTSGLDGFAAVAPFGPEGMLVSVISATGHARSVSLPKDVRDSRLGYVAYHNDWIVLSVGGGFSDADSFSFVRAPSGTMFPLEHGGPVAVSNDWLAILQPSAPEGAREDSMYLYKLDKNGPPQLERKIRFAIAAAFQPGRMAYVVARPGGQGKLCIKSTDY